jgi:DNA-binding response OmpR family regulator
MRFVDPKGRGVIVVADDDPQCRAAVRRALEREHYLVLQARHGEEALEILRSGIAPAVRLIVLDLVMPKMTGWSLLKSLRSERELADIPVLIMSGEPVQRGASGIGATVPLLGKPFSREDLLAAVSAAADLTKPRGEVAAGGEARQLLSHGRGRAASLDDRRSR